VRARCGSAPLLARQALKREKSVRAARASKALLVME